MPHPRRAREADLEALLALFAVAEVSAFAIPPERAAALWAEILAAPHMAVFVTEAGGGIGATCTLITAPNLLRAGQGHGFLENVVTHPAHRGRGHGRAVVRAALAEAWARGCFQVLLQSGRKDPAVHRFYEGCGFVPGLRTAYAARRPAPA
ncbi:GNAT family N-acetyltransferase [Siccirubricoccus sp. KC 17139]|uniref:GNAT family N-acetyltransferase n=1 Tax=Siccirubricoccus soli TaxID=2899147 RepID=A0ABT1D079_9PROT|nr:GNAT family N-acetyltransferase [Siccirubricoccus soli]MCO6414659.1 GNAT family N-acetyltransferase [Siccirubricoccus soli]MCP2680789.1 GNAT family N-acetyltransferase [Siccirubricoccus soli]